MSSSGGDPEQTQARIRALAEKWRGFAAEPMQVPDNFDINVEAATTWFNGRNRAYSTCADELEAELDALVASPLVPDGLKVAVGGRMERSIADFIRACDIHLVAQQESILPDNALIAVLCDAVRLAREHLQLDDLAEARPATPEEVQASAARMMEKHRPSLERLAAKEQK